MNETIPVVAAVVRHSDTYLVARRPDHKRHGGMWEFPGGKVLEDETMLEAVSRELLEELGVATVSIGERVFSARDEGTAFVIHFVETDISGEPRSIEHSGIRWVALEELKTMSLAPSDAAFVAQLDG